jgi:hypothetical protein
VSAVADLADVEFCYLTTRGRASGDPHRIEIWFVAHADGAYLLSNSTEADWYRNLGSCSRSRGERRDTTARAVDATDPANRAVRPAMVAKYQAGYAQEDLRDWSDTASLVRVDWPA